MADFIQVACTLLDKSRTHATVLVGMLATTQSLDRVIDAVIARYTAEHDLPDGLQYAQLAEIPTTYWEAAGLRLATFLPARVYRGPSQIVEPEERILPTTPARG
jgi:hypothetical protein